MSWNPDDPFPGSAALGETEGGARNLPRFLCSLLVPGPVLVVGSCEVALAAAAERDVVVLDWNRRRLTSLEQSVRERGRSVRTICRDPERQELGLGPRSVTNVVCLDALERFHDDVAVLEKLHRVLAPEGRLVVRVRAVPWKVGAAGAGGARHYDPESLRAALEGAGLRALHLRHWNFVGVPKAWVDGRWRAPADRGTPGVPQSERPRHWWDDALDLWFRAVENRVGFPAGVSLVAVATPHVAKTRVGSAELAKGMVGRAAREAYGPMASVRQHTSASASS